MNGQLKNLVIAAAVFTLFAMLTGCEPEKSSEKKILSFAFTTPLATGVISESTRTIAVEVPVGTNVTALAPVIQVSSEAIVNPASGIPNNFTNPAVYTVTAEDGSSTTYTVTVTIGGSGTTDPTQLPNGINENTTLPDLGLPIDYVINGTFNVNGNALLTIEPGVTIMFTGTNGEINVGKDAGIKMVGTSDKPIVITGPANNQNKGAWNCVRVRSNRADNQFEYVQMTNGGSSTGSWQAVLVLYGGATLSMKNCLIDGGLNNGVDSEGGGLFTVFENNIIKNCNNYPLYSEGGIYPYSKIAGNNVFTGNTKNYVYINSNTSPDEDMTLTKLSIPYYFNGGFSIKDNVTVTIAPGTTMLLGAGQNIEVSANALFIAEGTVNERITIRGFMDEPGYMNAIRMKSIRNGNKLNYCDISGGGRAEGWSSNSNLYVYPGIRMEIRNTTFSKSYHYGVGIENPNNLHLTHENVVFVGCERGNVWYYNDGSVHDELP